MTSERMIQKRTCFNTDRPLVHWGVYKYWIGQLQRWILLIYVHGLIATPSYPVLQIMICYSRNSIHCSFSTWGVSDTLRHIMKISMAESLQNTIQPDDVRANFHVFLSMFWFMKFEADLSDALAWMMLLMIVMILLTQVMIIVTMFMPVAIDIKSH